MNMSASEDPYRQHYGFYTFGLFTSRRRALACIQMRGMSAGVLSILPVSINEPLRPCLSSDVLTAHETRQMVSLMDPGGPCHQDCTIAPSKDMTSM